MTNKRPTRFPWRASFLFSEQTFGGELILGELHQGGQMLLSFSHRPMLPANRLAVGFPDPISLPAELPVSEVIFWSVAAFEVHQVGDLIHRRAQGDVFHAGRGSATE